MTPFILLTRLMPGSFSSPSDLEALEKKVMERIRAECPEVVWESSFAVLGPYDYLDVFRAPDIATAAEVSTIVRTFGHATTEIWGALDWQRYKDIVRSLTPMASDEVGQEKV